MVQIVPPDADWSKAFRNIGAGISEGYINRADEKAIQSAIEALGENPEPRALLNAVMGVNTYRPESKQRAMQNLMGAEQFEQTRQNYKAQQEQKQAQLKFEANKANIENIQREKEEAERAQVVQSIAAMMPDMDDAQRAEFAQGLGSDAKMAKELYIAAMNRTGKMSKLEEKIASNKIDTYLEAQNNLPILEDNMANIQRAQEISDTIGAAGSIANKFVNTKAGQELKNLSTTLVKPIVEIFNPSGPIATQKFKIILEDFGVNPSDFPWVRNAKLAVLRRMGEQAIDREQQKIALYQKYDGVPPDSIVERFNQDSMQMFDEISGIEKKDLKAISSADPKIAPNKIITSPDGQKYYSDGKTWQKL